MDSYDIAVACPFSPPWTEDVVGSACNLGTWGWVLDSSLGTCKELWMVMAPHFSEFGEAKVVHPMGGTPRDLSERKGNSKKWPRGCKRPREEGITHSRGEAVVRGCRWEGKESLEGTHKSTPCKKGPGINLSVQEALRPLYSSNALSLSFASSNQALLSYYLFFPLLIFHTGEA